AFTNRHLWIVIMGLVVFSGIIYAVTELGWWMAEMGGGFFLIGILAIVISGLSLSEAVKAFIKGMEEMVVAALVVGFARGIVVVLNEAQVLDTIIFSAAQVLQTLPKSVAAIGMFVFQTTLNFFIPSGSGQAAVTMPLMAPLADILGISRETAVFAFTCGDGFSNSLIPTSGVLMAMLSLAGIPYERWLRFVVPLFLLMSGLSALFLFLSVMIPGFWG
ncbi:MAG TPA: Na+/H+ antiporter NhaC family protein, partial [Calditrichia bacterium]|nr:Na+/H+ antiporter NhaC family protein [Calditrichia bacterium]